MRIELQAELDALEAGFQEAGGLEGPGIDFYSKPAGDPALSAEYFKKAGYASGKYEGDEELGRHENVDQRGLAAVDASQRAVDRVR